MIAEIWEWHDIDIKEGRETSSQVIRRVLKQNFKLVKRAEYYYSNSIDGREDEGTDVRLQALETSKPEQTLVQRHVCIVPHLNDMKCRSVQADWLIDLHLNPVQSHPHVNYL